METSTLVALSIEEALARLATYRGSAQLIANGTSLAPRIARGEFLDKVLVDISRILILRRITEENGTLQIGGAVTFDRLTASPLVLRKAPLLALAAKQMISMGCGSASLAGDTVSSLPMALSVLALAAMKAETRIVNLTGSQWLPLVSLFQQNGVCRIDSASELIASYRFPLQEASEGFSLVTVPDERHNLACALRIQTIQNNKIQYVWAVKTSITAPIVMDIDEQSLPNNGKSAEMVAESIAEAMLIRLRELKLPAGSQLPTVTELISPVLTGLQQARSSTIITATIPG